MNIILSIPTIVWLIISALFFALGEYLSKKFAISPSWYFLISVVIIDAIGTLAWLPAILETNKLSIVGAIWSVLSLLLTVLIGIAIFHEHLNTVGIFGIIFAFISIILLSIA